MPRSSLSRRAVALLVVTVFAVPLSALAEMSSTNYQIPWDTFVSGGLDHGGSEQYQASDSIGGGYDAIEMSSGSYAAQAGYRSGDDRPLSFEVAMAPVGGTSALYSSVSVSGKTVQIVSSAQAAAFSPGDMIALVESPGLSQLVVVGKVVSIAGPTVTVDRFDGDTSTISATPTAGSARVVLLSGSSMAFGSIAAGTPSIATGVLSVTSDVRSGYTVYAVADGHPRTADGFDVDPVTDGAVSAGSEEYGIEVAGARASTSGDAALSTTQITVQNSASRSATPADRVALIYKLSISASLTQAGTYSQSVSFTLTPNY